MNILDRNAIERELLLATVPLMSREELESLLAQMRREITQLLEDEEEEQGEGSR